MARLMLSMSGNGHETVQRRITMSNFQSFAGGAVWMAVAAILMLMTFEPVQVGHEAAAPAARHAAI